jgi:hypothetical protein
MPKTRRGFQVILVGLICLAVLLPCTDAVAGADRYKTIPVTNKGKKWRIGYYEGGAYINYPLNLSAIAQGLAALGWMDSGTITDMADPTDAKEVWMVLAKAKSDYLQFVPDAHHLLVGW